jgi:ribosome-associated heat shock protein Hsp15
LPRITPITRILKTYFSAIGVIRGKIIFNSTMTENQRADKWLWSVRLFKTRSMASDACKGGKIKLQGDAIKPAKILKIGDEISFRSGLVNRTVKVLSFPVSRVGAKLVEQYVEDLTPAAEYEKAKDIVKYEKPFFFTGKGRPTKKDRRKMDDYL